MTATCKIIPIFQTSTESSRNVAGISVPHIFSLDKMRDEYRAACADLVWRTFAAPSENACAEAAHKFTGVSVDTFVRLLRQETQSPDPAVMGFLSALHTAITGQPSSVMLLWADVCGLDCTVRK